MKRTILFSVLILLTCNLLFGQKTTSTYYFAHSLISHEKLANNQANIPFWLAEMEKAAGDVCLTSGKYAAGQFGASALPPTQTWSFFYQNDNHGSAMLPDGPYVPGTHDNIVLTYMNWELISDGGGNIGSRIPQTVSNANKSIAVIFNWMNTNDPGRNLYLYECWPKIENNYIMNGQAWTSTPGTPPNATQWASYTQLALGHQHNFYRELQDSLIINSGISTTKVIPSSNICAKLWQPGGLLQDFTVTDLFVDGGPHGKPSAYFLAAMIVYAAQHKKDPTKPFNSHAQIDQRILDRFSQISTFIMSELTAFNFPNGSSRVWDAVADSENPVQSGSLVASNITYNSANLNWNDATDNFGVTAYDIYVNGVFRANSLTSSYTLTGLTCNTAYNNVQVRARDAAGNSSSFITTSFTTSSCPVDNIPPTSPTGLTSARINNSSTLISWNASTDNFGVASYTIRLNGNVLATQTGRNYTISNLTCGQIFDVSVIATDNNGNSSAPTTLRATNICRPLYTLTLSYDDKMGNIQISPTPNGTYQNGSIIATYEEGSNITLYRYPGSGYAFTGYTGDLITSNDPASFLMNGNKAITANFIPAQVNTTGILMDWDFTGQGGNASVPAISVMNGISSTSPSAVVNIGPVFVFETNWPNAANNMNLSNQNQTTLAGAISARNYITFTITPRSNYEMSIDSIKVKAFSQNQLRNFTLMSSVAGFTAGNEISTLTTTSATKYMRTTNHTNRTSAIEFRIYVWGTNNIYEAFGLNDLVIYGKVKNSLTTSVKVESNETMSDVVLYPNPSSTEINIESKIEILIVEIFDLSGTLVHSKITNSTSCKLSTDGLNSGLYMAKVLLKNGNISINKISIYK